MRWGLVPYWTKGVLLKHSTINVRAETIDPTVPRQTVPYRRAWKHGQRCIILANGYYEWYDAGTGERQPYYIRPIDSEGSSFMFAGLWDATTTTDGVEILSCAIITLPANELMASIHGDRQRMPAILPAADAEMWLKGSPQDAWRVLKQYPAEKMMVWRVSEKVNNPENDGPELIERLVEVPAIDLPCNAPVFRPRPAHGLPLSQNV